MRCYTGAATDEMFLILSSPADGPRPGAIYPTVIGRFVQLQLAQQRDLSHRMQQSAIHIKLVGRTIIFYIKVGATKYLPAGCEFETHVVEEMLHLNMVDSPPAGKTSIDQLEFRVLSRLWNNGAVPLYR